jgi:formate--tetrahydrofolate ligase
MAILCLAKDVDDLKQRISNITVAFNMDGNPVTVKDLKCEGAITLILKDAIKPNLVQTLYHTPALVHGGPFANIAHGCNSIIATKMARKLADYVVTEAGFGADLGAEKFLDIKCREAGITPSCVVIVATIRALKMHGFAEDYTKPDLEALKNGVCNLEKHIESVKYYNLPYVICINRFLTDTEEEINYLYSWAKENGHKVALSEVFAKGNVGGVDLANLVIEECEKPNNYKPIYDLNDSIENKIETIATKIYGARRVVYSDEALENIKDCYKFGYDKYYVCMAKTPNSLTDDPKIMGRPTDFDINVKEIRVSSGAKFIVVLTGSIMTMPGLPKEPQALKMDFVDGKAKGIF